MKTSLLVLVLAAGLRPVGADEPAPSDAERKDGLRWVQPSPVPPVATGRPVRGSSPAPLPAPGPPSGELSGLRAVALGEGRGTIALRGATRAVQAGDRIGSALVKAVGSDRIILERPARPAGAGVPAEDRATIVVTFGPGGEAHVRTYVLPGATMPPPEVR